MIDRRHSVDFVNGKKNAMYFKPGYIPSMGQMIPHNITIGKKLPIAMYVAVRSLSHADDTTKPVKIQISKLKSKFFHRNKEKKKQFKIHTETHATQSGQYR